MIKAAWTRLGGFAPDQGPALPAVLTPAEAERADRFKIPDRKRQYLTGHGLLRLLASQVLNLPADRIGLSAEGRPVFEASPSPIWLSLAHSGPFVSAIASDEGPVGVDIEILDQERDWAKLAKGMRWDAEAASDKRGFLERWTLREAEFKAGLPAGSGFARHAILADFCITLVSATETKAAWLGPEIPGPFYELVTRPPRR
jgi:4'-phosphopantetheinyl transferase EntD